MYDPNDLACEIFFRQAEPGMKDKELQRLALRSCQMSDIFWTELGRYAGTKPRPLAAPANLAPAVQSGTGAALPNYYPPGTRAPTPEE